MTPEQIEKWAREAEAYAQRNASHDIPHHVVFNTEFARLVAADTWKQAANIALPKGSRPCMCDWCTCGNATDMASCWAWDERVVIANELRAAAAKEARP